MNNGWIKLHRQIIDNDIFRHDLNAWHVFEVLLLLADRRNASWSGGRFTLAEACNIKPTTLYKCLKRLEKAEMVTLSSNNKYTTIHICNWDKYQEDGNSSGNNKVTTKGQQSNTITRSKNKELRNNKRDVEKIFAHYIKTFNKNPNQTKLTQKRISKISERVKETSVEMVMSAITNVSRQPFYMGDNDRGWKADIDFITRNYEQIERFADSEDKAPDIKDIKIDWDKVK